MVRIHPVFLGIACVSFLVMACKADEPAKGYFLAAPISSTGTFLVDTDGRVVHEWRSEYKPGMAAFLLDNGHLLRAGAVGPTKNRNFGWGGAGGVIEEFDWDGNLVWRYEYCGDDHQQHHDIEPMPNGNVLFTAWELKTRDETLAVGRDPEFVNEAGMWPTCVIEVKPIRPEGGEIVWEWHVWDHLVQEKDPKLPNYAPIASRPERVNVNPPDWVGGLSDQQRAELESLGYLGGPAKKQPAAPVPQAPKGMPQTHPDWNHTNGIDYNEDLDQIVISVLGQNEIWIIDHSTTTDEAAGSEGGRYGKGGDLLYRWGNPRMHGVKDAEQTLFAQHDAYWISEGLPGAGHMMVFNNGRGRPGGDYSSVDELILPESDPGVYERDDAKGFAPAEMTWSYTAQEKRTFNSGFVSGSQRIANGDTVICAGANGRVFAVTPEGETVWEVSLPVAQGAPFGMMGPGMMGPGMMGPGMMGPGPMGPDFLKGLFDNLDTDKDGMLTREEFGKMPMPGMPMMGPMPFGGPMPMQGGGMFGGMPGQMPMGGMPGQMPGQMGQMPGQMPPGGGNAPGEQRMGGMGPGGMAPGVWSNGPPNTLFTAPYYTDDQLALQGKDLTPGATLVDTIAKESPGPMGMAPGMGPGFMGQPGPPAR